MSVRADPDDPEYLDARHYVRELRGFYQHALAYVAVNASLAMLNFATSPDYWWTRWVLMGWGIGLAVHGISTFVWRGFLGRDWEQRKIAEYLARKKG